jgi:nicotinate-nucleotide pyrophosphorylase
MTGVQLWISCVENIIAANTIARQRKPGLFLYANGTTLASSMPRTWNRGISPLFWNVAEGNRVEECSAGALVTSGDAPKLPIEFPRALGNVLRHNSFIRSRTDGVVLVSRKGAAVVGDTSASVAGTVVEFNVVRDATTAYHAAGSSDAIVFRRNHAYFWYPVNTSTNAAVAFAVDEPGAMVAIEQNSVEGVHGVGEKRIIEVLRAKENGK